MSLDGGSSMMARREEYQADGAARKQARLLVAPLSPGDTEIQVRHRNTLGVPFYMDYAMNRSNFYSNYHKANFGAPAD
jgi:hypothetical protein